VAIPNALRPAGILPVVRNKGKMPSPPSLVIGWATGLPMLKLMIPSFIYYAAGY